MGCVQAKPSLNSLPRGLHKIKADHSYAIRALPKRPPVRTPSWDDPPPKLTDVGDLVRGWESNRSVVPREEERCVKPLLSPLSLQRPPATAEEGEMVNGWPRCLTENISPEIVQGTYSNVYKVRDCDY